VTEPSKVPHKDKWPTGNVQEFHMYQCPICKQWGRSRASAVKKAHFCPSCGVLMQPRGIMQLKV